MSGDKLVLATVAALAAAGLARRRGSRSVSELNDAFWRWFGNSKVVDRQGQPMVVYHGSPAEPGEIEAFDPERIGEANPGGIDGFFFASRVATADAYRPRDYTIKPRYAEIWQRLHDEEKRLGAELLTAWNDHYGTDYPLDHDTLFLKDAQGEYVFHPPEHIDALERKLRRVRGEIHAGYDDQGKTTPKFWNRSPGGTRIAAYLSLQDPLEIDTRGAAWSHDFDARLKAVLAQTGDSLDYYDGLILRNFYDGETGLRDDIYVAFQPEQIKAVDNLGTWDPTDPRMSFNRRAR
jgi:hypothetical protein